jgi:hypothetical protein
MMVLGGVGMVKRGRLMPLPAAQEDVTHTLAFRNCIYERVTLFMIWEESYPSGVS